MSHLRRPKVSRSEELLVTLSVQPGLPSLGSRELRGPVEAAVRAGSDRFGFRLISYKAGPGSFELRVTATDRRALARGMQGLSVRIARAVNRLLERKGRLFVDRYDVRPAGENNS
ncbi:MAG TPA: hypothetical protein VFS67_01580 [Polyangiaceae bacterium]|nr:hypothetical protein [Polyangiaceae bacterium]